MWPYVFVAYTSHLGVGALQLRVFSTSPHPTTPPTSGLGHSRCFLRCMWRGKQSKIISRRRNSSEEERGLSGQSVARHLWSCHDKTADVRLNNVSSGLARPCSDLLKVLLSDRGSLLSRGGGISEETCIFSFTSQLFVYRGRKRPRRTDVNMWPLRGVLCDNTCRWLKTSSKGQQRFQDESYLCYSIMKSADVKPTKITVSVEEKFSRTVQH